MSEKFRGNSPNSRTRVVTDEAKATSARAAQAYAQRNKKNVSFFNQYGYHVVLGGFVALVILAFANTFFSKSRNPDITPVIEEDEIAAHNSRGFTYKLGPNKHFD